MIFAFCGGAPLLIAQGTEIIARVIGQPYGGDMQRSTVVLPVQSGNSSPDTWILKRNVLCMYFTNGIALRWVYEVLLRCCYRQTRT
ncbi:hypothetical protein GGR53DRAFT_426701 [Hypoxylon sp. FL1150]|nr:hypothetical protein GGR53DRAFT_426701 [Hypoxylon sp. FL1150]